MLYSKKSGLRRESTGCRLGKLCVYRQISCCDKLVAALEPQRLPAHQTRNHVASCQTYESMLGQQVEPSFATRKVMIKGRPPSHPRPCTLSLPTMFVPRPSKQLATLLVATTAFLLLVILFRLETFHLPISRLTWASSHASQTPLPGSLLDAFFPLADMAFNDRWPNENNNQLRALLHCAAAGTCAQNQTKVVILASWHFAGALQGGVSGEKVWYGHLAQNYRRRRIANSKYRANSIVNYPLVGFMLDIDHALLDGCAHESRVHFPHRRARRPYWQPLPHLPFACDCRYHGSHFHPQVSSQRRMHPV